MLSAGLTYAQPRGATVQTINGKKYYVHTVKKGETLYEISKKYKVSLADVLNENPGKEDKIDIGDKIKIPVTNKNKPKNDEVAENTNNTSNTNNTNFTPPVVTTDGNKKFHTVERKETIYGIAKKYGISPERIYELNPEARNGITAGQKLLIEVGQTASVGKEIKKVIIDHTVQPSETFFSISRKYSISQDSIKLLNNGLNDGLKAGAIIKLAVAESRKDEFLKMEQSFPVIVQPVTVEGLKGVFNTGKKQVYEVGLMMPFFLDKNTDEMMKDEKPGVRPHLYEPTRQTLDFYHGVLLAIDSLKKAGLSVNLRVYDTYKDSNMVRKHVNKEEFKKLDLIIGPTEHIEIVAAKAKEYRIPMVVPVPCSNKIILDNPYVFKTITTSSVMADVTSKYIIDKYKDANIMLIDGRGKNDVGIVKAYKKYLNQYYFAATGKRDSIRFLPMESYNKGLVEGLLHPTKPNIIIIPSNEFSFVSTALSNLNKYLARYNHKTVDVRVFGSDEWLKMDQIDITHKLRCQVHVPAPANVDFDTLQTHNLIRSFRNRFHTDPDKYGVMGFDIAYFWLAGYTKYGLDFNSMVPQFEIDMVNTGFRFSKMGDNNGYLNRNVYILKYENYKLVPQTE